MMSTGPILGRPALHHKLIVLTLCKLAKLHSCSLSGCYQGRSSCCESYGVPGCRVCRTGDLYVEPERQSCELDETFRSLLSLVDRSVRVDSRFGGVIHPGTEREQCCFGKYFDRQLVCLLSRMKLMHDCAFPVRCWVVVCLSAQHTVRRSDPFRCREEMRGDGIWCFGRNNGGSREVR